MFKCVRLRYNDDKMENCDYGNNVKITMAIYK